MDPTLLHDVDLAGAAIYFVILALIVIAAVVFNRSSNGDWVDETHGRGSIDDDWGWRPAGPLPTAVAATAAAPSSAQRASTSSSRS